MYATGSAKLTKFQTLWIVLLVFRGSIVAAFAGCASQRHHYTILFAFTRHFFLLRLGLPLLKINDNRL